MEPFEIPSHKSELEVDKDLSKKDILGYLQGIYDECLIKLEFLN